MNRDFKDLSLCNECKCLTLFILEKGVYMPRKEISSSLANLLLDSCKKRD